MNFSIVTIVYIIVSFYKCNNEYCNTLYNGETYFANIYEIFSIINVFLFFIFLFKAFKTVLNYAIIRYFSVCHSFIYFQLSKLMSIFENKESLPGGNSYFFIKLALLIIDIFFSLIFLEIIEVNICGISYNTKDNVRIRSDIEIEFVEKTKNEEDNSDEEEEKEIKEEKDEK